MNNGEGHMDWYSEQVSLLDKKDFTAEERREIFIKKVNRIATKDDLVLLLSRYSIKNMKKRRIIELLHDVIRNTIDLSPYVDTIVMCQRLWRQRRDLCHCRKPENAEDPFTFDTIEEIPIDRRYGYSDASGHYYVFDVVELECFIRREGCWNPYTKQKIPDDDIFKMYLFMKRNKIQKKKDELMWKSKMHALTDMSMAMERQGFYNDVEWMKKLTYAKCIKTIGIYRDLTNDTYYFQKELDKKAFVYDFSKEVMRLFKYADKHYQLCCNFVKALAMNIDELYNNLPDWLMTLESRSNYLNSANSSIYYYVHSLMAEENATDTYWRETLGVDR